MTIHFWFLEKECLEKAYKTIKRKFKNIDCFSIQELSENYELIFDIPFFVGVYLKFYPKFFDELTLMIHIADVPEIIETVIRFDSEGKMIVSEDWEVL